jgi:hypothetical protein
VEDVSGPDTPSPRAPANADRLGLSPVECWFLWTSPTLSLPAPLPFRPYRRRGRHLIPLGAARGPEDLLLQDLLLPQGRHLIPVADQFEDLFFRNSSSSQLFSQEVVQEARPWG